MKNLLLFLAFAAALLSCNRNETPAANAPAAAAANTMPQAEVPKDNINTPPASVPDLGTRARLSDDEWRERLTSKQFNVLREEGTERPGSGAYNKFYADGTYHCSACNAPLFSSSTKYDSKTGWPSFYQPIDDGRVEEHSDASLGITRVEVVCEHCGGHLGHIFTDGPEPTGLRYCINSVSLYFRPE